MAYIGNAKTPLLLASNVRDDLLPGDSIQGPSGLIFTKNEFDLSQEVPGGEGQNVTVVRRKFLSDVLIQDTDLITIQTDINTTTITTTDNYLAAALSVIQPKSDNYDGDDLKIVSAEGIVNATVNSVIYTRDAIEIVINKPISISPGVKVNLTRRYYGAWEILDPKTDYEIVGDFGTPSYHKKIRLEEAPQLNDLVYVLHRGDATYNFVPSPYSVGIEQLSDNLKNFRCDRFIVGGAGTANTHPFKLSQNAVNAKSLLVTVNGVVSEGDDLTEEFVGDWKLVEGDDNTQKIEFHELPDSGAKIRVLHLGFVAGLRRAVFAPGQEPASIADGSVSENKISDGAISTRTIKNNAVTTTKLQDSAVTSQKILLNASQNDGLRIQYSDGVKKLIGVNSDVTEVYSKTDFTFKKLNDTLLNLTSSEISPGTTNAVSLGTDSNKFSALNVSGSASVGSLAVTSSGATIAGGLVVTSSGAAITGTTNIAGATTISGNTAISGDLSVTGGNISVTGTVDGVDVSDLRDAVVALQAKVSTLIPVGTIMASGRSTAHTQDGVWLLCDGTQLNTYTYKELHAAISNAFGGATYQVGVTDQPEATTTFNLPDLRRRVVVGKSSSDSIGANEGATENNRLLEHNHTGAPHKHDLRAHTHSVPGHKHLITSSSTLRIESTTAKPSGGHTTNISHNHSETTTSVPYNIANTATSILSHKHDYTHQHAGSDGSGEITRQDGVDHWHAGTTTAGEGTHNHTSVGRGNTSDSGTQPLDAFRITGRTGSTQNFTINVGSTGSAHQHTFQTGVTIPWLGYSSGYLHTHKFVTVPHTGRTEFPHATDNSLVHVHRYTTPPFTGTSSNPAGGTDGAHSHAADTFSGSIGDDSEIDGNSIMSSGAPSINLTGDVDYTGYSGNTGDTTTPHLILNFIIKAKNS